MRSALCLAIVLLAGACSAAPAVASEPAPFDVPGAAVVLDPGGTMSLAQAQRSTFEPASAFVYPGLASPIHPLVLWVRFPAPPSGVWYLVGAPGVGYARLYEPVPQAGAYAASTFGTRVPFDERSIARVPPTVRIGPSSGRAPLYVRISLDDESRVQSILSLKDRAALRRQDAALERMASISLLFIGIFISLAAANVFVFLFVREKTYVIYSAMMLSNALFAACYVHGSAWRWLWPFASLADTPVQGSVIILEAIALLAFARTFLGTARLVPRADRMATWSCSALIAIAALVCYVIPSAHVGPLAIGRTIFLLSVVAFVVIVFWLGLAALRAGSVVARFFVASNGVVTLTAALVALANLTRHDAGTTANYAALMAGQALEGWLLFGALAYRLRRVIGGHTDEQQRRRVAQAELVAQAQALLETQRLATTDALTGIGNRRNFDETLEREWERCARAVAPLSLLLLDIDCFKLFNDRYGHVEGDACLHRVAQAVRSCVKRPTDLCARYGGEEFAVILGNTEAAGARAIAEEIAQAVRALAIPHEGSQAGCVSVSIGAATVVPAPVIAASSLVTQADAALYQAKKEGRNRVVSRRFGASDGRDARHHGGGDRYE